MNKKRRNHTSRIWTAVLLTLILILFTGGCFKKKEEKREYYYTLSELQDKRIGSIPGSVQAIQVQESLPNAKQYYFNNQSDMLNALRADKIDGYADSDAILKYMMRENPDLTYVDQRISGLMKGSAIFSKTAEGKALCDEYSEYIRRIKASGELEEIQESWIGENGEVRAVDLKSLSGGKRTLRLAVDPSMTPFAFVMNGELTGLDVDVFARFCKEKNYGVEVVEMEFAGILPAVSTGKCDLACGGIAYTEERAESLNFAEPTYEGGSAVAVLRPASKAPAVSLLDLKKPGVKFGSLTGSELYIISQDMFPEGKHAQYDSFADSFQALASGKVDAILGFGSQFFVERDEYPGITHLPDSLTVLHYGFATQKNDRGKKLSAQINEWFSQLKENGKFAELKEKWENSDGKQCMESYSFDGKNGELKIATGGSWEPNTFYVGDELTGFFIELMNSFCQEYGYRPSYESMPYVSEIAGLNAGDYDVIADAVSRIPERLESVTITDSMMDDPVYVFVPAVGGNEETGGGLEGFIASLKESFQKNLIREDRWKMLLSGFGVTLELSALAGLFGTILGAFVCFLRMRKDALLNGIADMYIRIFRGVPIVVLLLVLNYVVFTSSDFPAFWVCVIGFSLDFSAYTSEMFRNGIEAVPAGQSRAATALGFGTFHGFRKVVLPQALVHILPVYTGQFISLVKLTSVAGYISVMDLTRASDLIRSRTYEAFFPLILTAVIYFILSLILIAILRKIEKMIRPGSRRLKKIEELMEARDSGALKAKAPSGEGNHPESAADSENETKEVFYLVSHLKKSFENVCPVKDFNCEIRKGDIISVIGASGTGKSTFLNLLNQLETADSGEILFKGESITAPGYDLNGLRRRVGMVFQSFNLFSHLTIVENIMLAQEELLGRSKEDAFVYSMEVLERVGLPDKAMNYPSELSGGQQQRVAIARQVAMDPEMILFDEPTSALDPTTIGEVLTVIRNLAKKGMTMMIVTHEMNFARDVSNRVFYLDEGIIYEEGTPEQIFKAPRKEKTRQFIGHLKVLTLKIKGTVFDFGGAVTRIEAFGHQHALDRSMIRHMISILEELGIVILQGHYQEKTDVQFTFEYQEVVGKMHIKAIYDGPDFNPLEEGDAVSVALIKSTASDLTCYNEDGMGVIEGSC